jgi:rhodanese-related sulfurtransferase
MSKTILFSLVFAFLALTACQGAAVDKNAAVKSVPVAAAKTAVEAGNVQFIDVRTAEEYAGGHAPKAVNLPLDGLEKDLARLDRNKPVYVICETGRRSEKGAEILRKNAFAELYNVEGGTSAWRAAGLPIEK